MYTYTLLTISIILKGSLCSFPVPHHLPMSAVKWRPSVTTGYVSRVYTWWLCSHRLMFLWPIPIHHRSFLLCFPACKNYCLFIKSNHFMYFVQCYNLLKLNSEISIFYYLWMEVEASTFWLNISLKDVNNTLWKQKKWKIKSNMCFF